MNKDIKFKGDALGNCFTQRVMSAWNVLSGLVVEAYMIVPFNRRLDSLMEMEVCGACTGRYEMVLASGLAQTLWPKGLFYVV